MKERRYLMKEIKSKERRGCIFFDKVNRVIAAIQRSHGKYDYLIEWKYNEEDKLTPTSSIVKGSHFVFANPLLYRRHVESQYLETKKVRIDEPVIYY
jgi:hypothetical protein